MSYVEISKIHTSKWWESILCSLIHTNPYKEHDSASKPKNTSLFLYLDQYLEVIQGEDSGF